MRSNSLLRFTSAVSVCMDDILKSNIDLELSIRLANANVARANIRWAEAMRRGLVANVAAPPRLNAHLFKEQAVATYNAIKITSVVPSVPQTTTQPAAEISPTDYPPILDPSSLRNSKPLFIQHPSTPAHVILLRCPTCLRLSFPTIQGILNHSRMAHSQDLGGTHEDCIQRCSLLVRNSEEAQWIRHHGTQLIVESTLPSLKRVFERAVGHDAYSISESLGIHAETPALALFLKKNVRKRCIHVYDPTEPIDILGPEDDRPRGLGGNIWSPLRHKRRRGLDSTLEDELETTIPNTEKSLSTVSDREFSSRFHVKKRVVITDSSQWVPEDRRLLPSHSHRWMLTISSPSYEQHISTFLSSVTFIYTVDNERTESTTISSPGPFSILRTSGNSFLAKIVLQCVGPNSSLELEHWVQLDESKHVRPIVGEEQMLDVELDRNTVLLEPIEVAPLSWGSLKDVGSEANDPSATTHVASKDPPGIFDIIKGLSSKFPLTNDDIKTRPAPKLSYRPVKSRGTLLGYSMGKRKAIEWKHALLIRDTALTQIEDSDAKSLLTTAYVFKSLEWLGVFPRPLVRVIRPRKNEKNEAQTKAIAQKPVPHCAYCGVSVFAHAIAERVELGEGLHGYVCYRPSAPHVKKEDAGSSSTVMSFPFQLVDFNLWLRSEQTRALSSVRLTATHEDVVRLANPKITLALLDHFSPSRSKFSTRHISAVTPYALLAAAIQMFVRDLVYRSLGYMGPRSIQGSHESGVPETNSIRLLTPTHVLQALTARIAMGDAVGLALAQVGSLVGGEGVWFPGTHSASPLAFVKVEDV